jgi:ElaB/YqjD/DUF883 family membrane-anchored ribosome-binding protein
MMTITGICRFERRIQMQQVTTEKLMQDLRLVIEDGEALLKATAGQADEKVAQVRARAEESLRQARMRLQDAGIELEARVRDTARAADEYVHTNPWQSIGVAAGVAFLVGYLIGRR